MKLIEKIMLSLQAAIVLILFVFSYSYVDLNLTLSSSPQVLYIISSLQQVAYFQRPQATIIYMLLLISSFSLFVFNLYLFSQNKLSKTYLITNTFLSTFVLVFSYPFLSSDIFNYMFDAKIITLYHQSPYLHKALDYPTDDWIRFMRWVHRYSPYGPLWLVLSTLPSIIGFGKFVLTLLMFKIFIGALHIVNGMIIYKILKIQNAKNILLKTSLYSLNPLFLIEGVVNAHNDVLIATFILLSLYFAIKDKKVISILSLMMGALTKYITFLNLPWFIYYLFFDKKKNFYLLVLLNILTMTAFTIFYSNYQIRVPFISSSGLQVQFQPWYLFWTLPIATLIAGNTFVIMLSITLSFSVALRYLPYLFYGAWSHPGTIQYMKYVTLIPIVCVATIWFVKVHLRNKLKIET